MIEFQLPNSSAVRPTSAMAGLSERQRATLDVIRRALEAAGVEFIDQNGGGPGVRLRHPERPE